MADFSVDITSKNNSDLTIHCFTGRNGSRQNLPPKMFPVRPLSATVSGRRESHVHRQRGAVPKMCSDTRQGYQHPSDQPYRQQP